MATIIKSREIEDNNICGIVYANSFDGSAVNKLVWDQFDKQRSRGVQGFGFFNGKYTIKAAIEKRIKHKLESKKNQTDLLLFHHRFPTSTENVKRAAHPFNTGDYFGRVRYVMVHNGVIRNPKDTYEKHQKMKKKITYQSLLDNGKFNDSEALMWDLALTLEGKQKEMTVYGDMAFICIKMVDNVPVQMFFGRNTRPLKMKRDKVGMFLSSEGEGEEVAAQKLYTYNYKKKRLTEKVFRIPSYNPTYSTGWGYGSGYTSKANGYSSGATSSTSHTHHVNNVCASPSSGAKGNPVTSEIDWRDLADEDDIIWDSSGGVHYPYEATFYEDGTYDIWNDEKETWETQYWNEDEFKANSSLFAEKKAEKKFFDFIKAPTQGRKERPKIITKVPPIVQILKPNQNDVALRLLHELGLAEGFYDAAYFNMEERWVALQEKNDAFLAPLEERKEMALLSEAMKQIEALPEYIDDTSRHPLWKIQPTEDNQTSFLLPEAIGVS